MMYVNWIGFYQLGLDPPKYIKSNHVDLEFTTSIRIHKLKTWGQEL